MTVEAIDRVETDTTPMTTCDSCTGPVDMQGHARASAYIHRVEEERQQAEDLSVQMLVALEPFAAMANRYGKEHPDCTVVMTWQDKPVVTLGDLRRAKHYVDLY